MVYECLEKELWGDRIYEFAQERFRNYIDSISYKYEIDKRELCSDEEWYDEIYEDFFESVYAKMIEFFKRGE